jgi:hypothetical protein
MDYIGAVVFRVCGGADAWRRGAVRFLSGRHRSL